MENSRHISRSKTLGIFLRDCLHCIEWNLSCPSNVTYLIFGRCSVIFVKNTFLKFEWRRTMRQFGVANRKENR